MSCLQTVRGKRRFPGRWTPYGTNTRIPCVVAVQIDSAEADYMLFFLCRNDSEELLLLKTELHGKDRWYTLESPALAGGSGIISCIRMIPQAAL